MIYAPLPHNQCSQCNQFKPWTKQYFGWRSDGGIFQPCRECLKANARYRYCHAAATGMFYIPYPFIRCSQCGTEYLPTRRFFVWSRREGLAQPCRECRRAYGRQYARERHSEISERNKIRYKRNKEQVKPIHQRYYRDHRDEVLERVRCWQVQNPGRVEEYKRKSRKKHPNAARAAVERRKAKKLQLPNTLTAEQWERCLEYWGYVCCVCGQREGFWYTLAQEHWIPLRPDFECLNNPGTVAVNILPMCHAKKGGKNCCNRNKANRDPLKWLVSKFGKRKAKQILKRVQDYFEWVEEQDK